MHITLIFNQFMRLFDTFRCIIDAHKFKPSLDGHNILMRIFPNDKFVDAYNFDTPPVYGNI